MKPCANVSIYHCFTTLKKYMHKHTTFYTTFFPKTHSSKGYIYVVHKIFQVSGLLYQTTTFESMNIGRDFSSQISEWKQR